MRFGKTQKISLLIALLILVAGLIYAYWHRFTALPTISTEKKEGETTSAVLEEKQETFCPFCGLPSGKDEFFRPVAVIFDNHLSALPHNGISSACLIFETLAEGGITRIEAFYHHKKPEIVGPVRSARIYFVDFALSYDALLAHCGGSPDALSFLKKTPIDLDQIRFSYPYFRSKSRKAPHNLYGYFSRFFEQAKRLGYSLTLKNEDYFQFEEESELESTQATKILVPFTSRAYSVTWVYNPSAESYLRYTSKGLYIDESTKKPVQVKNVVVLKTQMSVRDEKGRLDINLQGKGQAWFFKKGKAFEGYWEKTPGKPFTFSDKTGNPFNFNPGIIWIEILPANLKPSYSP